MHTSTTEFPSWSGKPRLTGLDQMVVSIHIADTRMVQLPGWEHVETIETEAGDVEHHIFRRKL